MMKKLLLIGFLLAFGCAKPKYWTPTNSDPLSGTKSDAGLCSQTFRLSNLCFELKWEIQPTRKNFASLILKTYRLNKFDGSIIMTDLARPPILVPTMPTMGHGTAETYTTVLDTGTYRFSHVSLYMKGPWLFEFLVENETERLDDAKYTYDMQFN